jgi:hypothetical protein
MTPAIAFMPSTLMDWLLLAYRSTAIIGLIFAIQYLRRAYWTTWYDPSMTGFFGKLSWNPDVGRLMTEDPLTHTRRFRWKQVVQPIKDLLFAVLIASGWAAGECGLELIRRGGVTEDRLKAAAFLFGFTSVAATLTGVFYQLRTKARSENRQNWIKEIRQELAPLIASLPSPTDTPKLTNKKRAGYFAHHAKLELLLNPSEPVHRALMMLLRRAYRFEPGPIDEIPATKLACILEQATDHELKSQIIRLANVALKREWEHVKHAR